MSSVCWDKMNFETKASQTNRTAAKARGSAGRPLTAPSGGPLAVPVLEHGACSLCSHGRRDPARANTLKIIYCCPD